MVKLSFLRFSFHFSCDFLALCIRSSARLHRQICFRGNPFPRSHCKKAGNADQYPGFSGRRNSLGHSFRGIILTSA